MRMILILVFLSMTVCFGEDEICYDLNDLAGCPAQIRCSQFSCDFPADANEAAQAGYTYLNINYNGIIDVTADANCPDDIRDNGVMSRVQSYQVVEGGQFVGLKNIAKQGGCWHIFLCDGDCQKTNITMGSFEFVVGTVVYPFTINYFECKSLQDPDSIGTVEINYFECLPDDCITIHS